MATIEINDIFHELIDENKRLNEYIKVLVEYKSFVDLIVIKMKTNLDSNDLKKFNELNENIGKVFSNNKSHQKTIQNNAVNKKFVKIQAKPVNENQNTSKTSKSLTKTYFIANNTETNANTVNTVLYYQDQSFVGVNNVFYSNHLITETSSKFKPIKCKICSKMFFNEEKLRTHINADHKSSEPNFKCLYDGCDKYYKTNAGLKIHTKYIHSGVKSFRCEWPDCQFKTHMKSCLKTHRILIHTKERKYVCDWPQCGKAFGLKYNLEYHKRIHKNEKPHQCVWPGCKYRSSHPSGLHKHIKVHKKQTENTSKTSKSLTNNLIQTSDETTTHLTTNNTKTNANTVNTERKVNQTNESIDTVKNKSTECVNKTPIIITKNNENRYICKYKDCNNRFISISALRSHVRAHTRGNGPNKDKPFRCNTCAIEYNCEEDLKSHIIEVHTNIKELLKCGINQTTTHLTTNNSKTNANTVNTVLYYQDKSLDGRLVMFEGCSKSFELKMHSDIQKKSHSSELNFKCMYGGCGQHYETEDALKTHVKSVHSGFHLYSKKQYVCDWPQCGKAFESAVKLKEHLIIGSDGVDPHSDLPLICGINNCNKVFDNKDSLKRHQNHIHLKRGKPNKCHICSKEYVDKKILETHIDSVHTRSEVPLKCGINDCKKVFYNKIRLKRHQNFNHLMEKQFVCDHPNCSKKFPNSGHLDVHKKTHSEERPFVCDFEGCSASFKTKNSLTVHKISHSSERNFKCLTDGCHKCFKTQTKLKMHDKCVHSGIKFRCEWPGCEYRTSFKSGLKTHRLVHTKERNYVCDWPQCGKAFGLAQHLKHHIKNHKNEKSHQCVWPGCTYRTAFSGNLNKHMKIHEK